MPYDVHYHCQRCTACCRWPGQVKVNEREIGTIAAFLQLEVDDFIQRFTRLRVQRDGLALIDKPNGECFFLEGNDCAINEVKPQQCRDFPNKWNFPGWRQVCEAVPELVGAREEIQGEGSLRKAERKGTNAVVSACDAERPG